VHFTLNFSVVEAAPIDAGPVVIDGGQGTDAAATVPGDTVPGDAGATVPGDAGPASAAPSRPGAGGCSYAPGARSPLALAGALALALLSRRRRAR
jgi:hypothetical protein